MSTTTVVSLSDLQFLLEIFERKSFEAGPCEEGTPEHEIIKKCEILFKQDYTLIELDNTNGILSPRYPGRIFIPEYEHGHMSSTITANNANQLSQQSSITATITPHSSSGSLNGFHQNSATSSNGSASTATMGTANSSIHCYLSFANSTMPTQQQQQQQPSTATTNTRPYVQTQMQYPQQMTPVPPLPAASSTATTTNGCGGGSGRQNTIYEDLYDVSKVRELINMAKYARCRQRFVVPVIMYRGKYICRSATISVMPETYGRKVVDYAYDCINGTNYSDRANHTVDDENNENNEDSLMNHPLNEPSQFTYDEVIKSDIQLLNALNVTTIVDLMVEKRKIKYFMAVSSSEKADPENHYEEFNLLSLPYPGCEFFKKFRDNNYMAEDLYYNWKQSFNDAHLSVPKLGPTNDLNIPWNDYKQWDLVLITQNYLKACLRYIQEETAGLLIHCISGWDRTPLFISLVRLSLWADGLIHQNLNEIQMVYFTMAYDWYLFGHQLPDRLKRGEDIMFFCFHVLKYITDEEFSIIEQRKRTKTTSSSGSSVIVIKSDFSEDEQPLKEDLVVGYEQDSNDSYSNSSNCDMSITDNFYATATTTATAAAAQQVAVAAAASCNNMVMNPLTSRSPNPKRSKTSPISVPGVSATRQRHESTSSNGSWQVVTETGSIDSMVNGSYMTPVRSQQPAEGNSVTSGHSGGNMGGGGPHASVNGGNCSNTPSNGSSSNASLAGNGVNNGGGIPVNYVGGATTEKEKKLTLRKKRLNSVRAIFIQAYGKSVGLKFKEGSSMTSFIGQFI